MDKIDESLEDAIEIDRALAEILNCDDLVQQMKIAELVEKYKKKGITKRILSKRLLDFKHEEIQSLKEIIPSNLEGLTLGVSIPPQYRINLEGIFKYFTDRDGSGNFVKIAPAPIFISAKTRSIDDGSVGVGITFYYDGKWTEIFVPQVQIATANEFLKLTNLGLLITARNVLEVIEFASEQQALSMTNLPEVLTTKRSGWLEYENTYYFSLGKTVLSPPGARAISRYIPDDLSKEVKFVGYHKGSVRDWLKAVGIIRRHKLVLFQFGSALIAPLLHLLRIQAFTYHNFDDSTTGKTVALRISLSIFGDPNDGCYLSTWETTELGMENRCYALNHLPVPSDDSSLARSASLIEHCIYMIGNGSARSRGTQTGGARESKPSKVVLLSNGEGLLLSSNSKTGQAVRTIQIKRNPWDLSPTTAEEIKEVEMRAKENFGFLGPIYLQRLVEIANDPERLQSLRMRSKEFVRQLSDSNVNKLVGRTLPMLAGVKIALSLAMEAMPELGITGEEIEKCIAEVLSIQNEALNNTTGVAYKAFQYVIDQIRANPWRFDVVDKERWGTMTSRRVGIEEQIGYAFIKTQLYKLLREGGYDPEAVCLQFKDKKWVWLDKKNQLYNVKMDGKGGRSYVFDFEIAEAEGILERDSEDIA